MNATPVIIGSKPVANYALAVATRFGKGERLVVLRARGELISKAVSAAHMAANMGFARRASEARIGQEDGPGGKPVSFIEIELAPAGVAG
jgi:DNA-binding protein Alba